MSAGGSYRRSMLLVTASSMLVPVMGLATAPILAHSLGVAGRGQSGAAMGPNLLIIGGATIGLDHALTYVLARRAHLTRAALGWAAGLTTGVSLLGVGVFVLLADRLSNGDTALARLMLIATAFSIPTLFMGLLRGAAIGRQMWTAVAVDRVVNSVLRLAALALLALLGRLDVMAAVLVMSAVPLIGGLAYLRVLRAPPRPVDEPAVPTLAVGREMLSFGSRVWLSSVAVMLMARLNQLMVTPLSDVQQLGLLLVAINISDVPYIVTATIREFVFGTHSADADVERLLSVSRTTTLLAVVGAVVLGGTLPLWITAVFGAGFSGAVVPTWLLLLSSTIAVPGLIAGAALDSAAHPGRRSVAMVAALAVNVAGLLLLVPPFGAVGAASATLAATLASTTTMVLWAGRTLGVPWHRLTTPGPRDVALLLSSVRVAAARLRPARRPVSAGSRSGAGGAGQE